MPELPEVEVIRRDLEREVVGRRIKDAEVRPGSNAMKIIPRHGRRKEFHDLLEGAKVDAIDRVGKKVVLGLDTQRSLVIDVGSSARILKTSASEPIAPHTHLVLGFTIGGQLRVIDPKITGEVFVTGVVDRDDLRKELRDFMIDPLEDQFTWQHFSMILEDRDAPLKKILSDGSFICGLGDIYSDELLWHAGLRFDRSSAKLSSQDVRRLYRALMEMLQDAVRARGTTWGSDGFHDVLGNPGQFQLELKVYEREGESCRRCRSAIVTDQFDGTTIYLCAQCQS